MQRSHRNSKPVREWPEIRAFRHLLRAHAKLQEEHRRFMTQAFDLNITEFDMIAALGNTPGKTMGALADAMITSPANVTRVAQTLERRGLATRQRAEHSDREVVARLTPAGEQFFQDHFLKVAQFTAGGLSSALTKDEVETLGDLLEKVLLNATFAA